MMRVSSELSSWMK